MVMMTVFCANAQEETTGAANGNAISKHELKVNALYLVLGLPEVSYEYIINEESAVGISAAFSVEENMGLDFMMTPYYRIYFGKKPAAGFFLEGNAAVFSEREVFGIYDNGNYYEEEDKAFGAGLGLGIGAKFMTKSGWIGEILGGLGRNFIEKDRISEIYPRFGITLGKRF